MGWLLCGPRFALGVIVGALMAVGTWWMIAARSAPPDASSDTVVAHVGGEAIYQADYLAWLDDQSGRLFSPEALLEGLVEQAALAAWAEKLGVTDDAHFRAAERSLRIAFLREDQLLADTAAIEISSEAIQSAYAAQRDQRFLRPARYEVAALWLNHRGREDLKITYQQRLGNVRDAVLNGAVPPESGFGDLALSATEHRASRFRGGILGWLDATDYPDALHAQAVLVAPELASGEVSPVITNDEGVFLVRLMQQEASAYRPLRDVRDQIEAELHAARRAEVEAAFVANALRNTEVILYPENLPAVTAETPDRLAHNLR